MKSTRLPVWHWVVAVGGAAVIMAGVLTLFRAPKSAPLVVAPEVKPSIIVIPGKRAELAMRDLSPLFLPTPFNAEPSELKAPEPGRTYFDRDAERWKYSEVGPALQLPPPVRPPATAVDALADTPGPLALGIGRVDQRPIARAVSGGHLDVFAKDARDSLLSIPLDPDAKPMVAGREIVGWSPVEFMGAVEGTGLAGQLLLARSSGVEEVDNHFRIYLAQRFRLGDRLPPGFYRIVVGP